MNKKFSPIKETNIEKGAIDIFKQKIERKKQNYLRFSFTKSYQNRKREENRNDEENDRAVLTNSNAVCPNCSGVCPNNDAICAKNKKVILIQTCDTHEKYILNLHDEESQSCEKDTHLEEEEEKEEKEKKKEEQKEEQKGEQKEEEKKQEKKYNHLDKKTQHKSSHKKEDNIYIPLKILSNKYDYSDIVQATNNFAEENKIAKGGNGVVYKGLLKSCISVAIKVLNKNENNGFENEVIIMSRYRHKNILSLLGYAVNPTYFYLIYEYAHFGDLRTLLFNHYYFYSIRERENVEVHFPCNVKQANPEFSPRRKIFPYGNDQLLMKKQSDLRNGMNNLRFSLLPNQHLQSTQRVPLFLSFHVRLNILIQIINVLCYLHTSSPIVYHRDLKSANILIDEKFNAKLGDFGLSFVYKNNNNVFNLTGGTPGYADPYYISTHEINEQTEIYSFGALILEMLVSKSPAVHVGKNYNCIYGTDDKCPIFCHRKKKSENEDNVFDYLVNHINMNDYKSIYAVLDHSVHFPEFLVEKLTKLSFLCLNPNIKNRPSSKLVNLILLEIQKESELYIKQKNELVQKKISCSGLKMDDYHKGEEDCAKVSMQSDGEHKKERKSQNVDGNGKVYTSEQKHNGRNTQKEGNEPNGQRYANSKGEINYDNVKEMFFKFMCAVFGGSQEHHLDQRKNIITKDEDVENKLSSNLSIEFYTTFFKTFLDVCTERSPNRQGTQDEERNEEQQIHSSPFKYNTVGNLTQMKDFFFDKLHKDIFFKNNFFNSFSLNLMNCYFAKFPGDYLQNYSSGRGLESPARGEEGGGKEATGKVTAGKVAPGKGSPIGGTTEDPQGSATNQFQLGSCANQNRFGRALNERPVGGAAPPCDANESSQQSRAPNCGLRRVGADEDVHNPFNVKRQVQVTPLGGNPTEGDGSWKGSENRSGKRSCSRSDSCGGKLSDALLSEGRNCRMRNKDANEGSTFLNQGGQPPGQAQNRKNHCCPPASINLIKNGYRARVPFQRNSHDPGGDPAQRNKPSIAMHRNNGKDKHYYQNYVDNANAVSRSSHQNQGPPDNEHPNQQNSTDYEKGNNCRDANNPMIGRNSQGRSPGISQGLCKNGTFGQAQQSGQNGIANCEDVLSLYSSPLLQNEKKPQQNGSVNKWALRRNCRESPAKVDFSVAQEQQQRQQLPGQKEQGINDKKKAMRMNVAVEEGKAAGSFGARRGGPRRGCGMVGRLSSGVSSGRGCHRGSNRDSLRDDGGMPPTRGPQENNVILISNFANYLNFDRDRSGIDSNAFEWFHKNVFELVIEENKVTSEVTFLDILYEFDIFTFKKNIILSNDPTLYGFQLGWDTSESSSTGKYSLSGKWSDYRNGENNFITDNLANEFFFEIAVYHDVVKNTHTVFLLKSNRSKHQMCNDSEIVLKKTWVSDYVGRRNDFVEKILKKSISNMLYECISRKHCLFLLQVQMRKLRQPTLCSDVSAMRREGFSYYLFEYNLRVVCNSDNCIFSNNYILYKNNIYSYTDQCNLLSLLVFSENQIMKGGGSPGKHSPITRQLVHFPLYPFFVNINLYSDR
ncbi:serine/threonine protein kinase [Plasmodium inui San Antonio 1]|uniref:Serine/threonine protein kinase n=1 Tax=Plasmodium inui San Antonio 1 TaxID=1237626 RepID=W7A181_9APIC|nr:serine/threonine protein kinase [Plasmodium inui San Antonio 1]EUD65430.1 serine/threonine protein kinase [Plasmodium inui San Antonio 1]